MFRQVGHDKDRKVHLRVELIHRGLQGLLVTMVRCSGTVRTRCPCRFQDLRNTRDPLDSVKTIDSIVKWILRAFCLPFLEDE